MAAVCSNISLFMSALMPIFESLSIYLVTSIAIKYSILLCLLIATIKSQIRFFFVQIETRAPRGTDRSPEYNEHFCK